MEKLLEILANFLNFTIAFLPNLIGVLVLLLIGWVTGSTIGKLLKKFLKRYKIDERFIKKPAIKFSEIIPTLVSWTIYLFFIWSAIEFLAIESLLIPFRIFFGFLPRLIEAIMIIIIGYAIGEYVRQQVEKSKVEFSGIISKVLFFSILYVSFAMALPLIGIDVTLLNNLLLIIVGSLGLGLAIALGLGLKDIVAEKAKEYLKKRK